MGEPWKLYYWGKSMNLCGRGEFVRLLFEEAGEAYVEEQDTEKCVQYFRAEKWPHYPVLAQPVIQKGDFTLAQAGVICRYLGKKFGLFPEKEEDEWHADQVNATIHDYIAEGRLAFHGINPTASYFTQQEETKPYIRRFEAERLPKFLRHFESCLKANNGGQGFLVGGKVTYVDLALLHVLRATASQFPEAWATQTPQLPLLLAFKARMEARPKLAAYFKSDRCRPFEGNSMM